jgi:hypothetical protein
MKIKRRSWISIVILIFCTIGCAHTDATQYSDLPPAVSEQMFLMKPIVEDLYLNHLELDRLYTDLHQVAKYYLFTPGDQLNYIQKTALFIQEAYRLGRAQWELFSVLEYIRPKAINDYFTLRAKGLENTIDDVRFTLKEIDLYKGFIENPKALKICRDAMGMIEANVRMMEKLLELTRPMTNKTGSEAQPAKTGVY